MRPSPIPLPVARRLLHQGSHFKALTDALLWVKRRIGTEELGRYRLSHTLTRLSLPPGASFAPAGFHFSPQITTECPAIVAVSCSRLVLLKDFYCVYYPSPLAQLAPYLGANLRHAYRKSEMSRNLSSSSAAVFSGITTLV